MASVCLTKNIWKCLIDQCTDQSPWWSWDFDLWNVWLFIWFQLRLVHVTHVSTLIKLCGHEQPTCSQTQVCMSLLSMLEVLACLCKGPCSLVEDASHLICNVWLYFLFRFRQVNQSVYMCAMRTSRSSRVWGHEQPTYSQIHACIFTSTMYKSWHGLEQG